ncbi:hypothetical protein Vretimale_740 [Volvox reticuliferus]|uniref:Uncharacterized protein n=1 Tax=Volvox reticuliferus TaxID=1737510 RepID=A0A8J4FXR9_9CHLO|nr:hypothetical protein Vretifemale_10585 [Volvox reticuliferus]GIL94782.1 hypothetical protein Vretimale_740 [Volvox reticuliferus]
MSVLTCVDQCRQDGMVSFLRRRPGYLKPKSSDQISGLDAVNYGCRCSDKGTKRKEDPALLASEGPPSGSCAMPAKVGGFKMTPPLPLLYKYELPLMLTLPRRPLLPMVISSAGDKGDCAIGTAVDPTIASVFAADAICVSNRPWSSA